MVKRAPDIIFCAKPHALENHQIARKPDGDCRKENMERDGKGELYPGQMKRIKLEHAPYLWN
ncbi:Uncharacterised protein [Enterobacter cloacae]|nr:Uncharacterised protein [Enterobacter cloacae]